MAIKPILFNTEMVRAILDGRKSCTRRIIKPQWEECPHCKYVHNEYIYDKLAENVYCARCGYPLVPERRAPYHTDDILYVRETWQCWRAHRYEATADIRFRAGGDDVRLQFANGNTDSINRLDYDTFVHKWFSYNGEWKPSLFMPKEAARIWLKVTDVRVERLQDITEDGAEAEGMPDSLDYPVDKAYCPLCKGEGIIGTVDVHSLGHMDVDCPYCDSYRKRFENLWNSIKQKSLDRYGWDASPWVWVIEFERCEKPQEV